MGRRRRNGAAAGRAAGCQRLAARATHATASTRGGNHWREAMTLVLLLLIPPGAGLLCLATNSRVWWERLNLAAFALVAGLALLVAGNVIHQGTISALGGFLHADALSALVIGLTAFVALVCGIYSVGYFRRDLKEGRVTEAQLRHYYVLTPLFVFGMLLVPLADNLGVMWVAIESTTLASVLLVTFYNQRTSFEAGWKYIIIGSVGISLALFGTVITYSSAVEVLGSHAGQGMNWSVLVKSADKFNPTAMRLAFVLVVLGYGTKAGLAPMHTWKPAAYAEAPVPAATLLAAAFINCAIYSIMRLRNLLDPARGAVCPGATQLSTLAGVFENRPCWNHGGRVGLRWTAGSPRGRAAHAVPWRDQAADVFLCGQCAAGVRLAVFA